MRGPEYIAPLLILKPRCKGLGEIARLPALCVQSRGQPF
jgi:hypothetical protein